MCLLRVLGKPEAAERLHDTELSQALAEAGLTEADPIFRSLYKEEERRAADAAALAELLAPLLTAGHPPKTAPSEIKVGNVVAFEKPAERPQLSSGPASIADMIDGMLAQDRGPPPKRKS
jgi:hypothetical protein